MLPHPTSLWRFVFVVCGVILIGCHPDRMSATIAERTSDSPQIDLLPVRVTDNTQSFVPQNSDQGELISLLAQFKAAHETYDLRTLQDVLAEDFELQHLISKNQIATEGRDTYISNRTNWSARKGSRRIVSYAIQSVIVTKTDATVVAASAYSSKYFRPHFIEVLICQRREDRWFLRRQIMVPLSPQKPEDYRVAIILGEQQQELIQQFPELAIEYGADYPIDRFLNQRRSTISSKGDVASVLFIFQEAPPIGSEIRIEHSWSPAGKHAVPRTTLSYQVEISRPFLVIDNINWVPNCCSGHKVTYKVFVNGTFVTEKVVAVK